MALRNRYMPLANPCCGIIVRMQTLPLFPLGRALFPDGVIYLNLFEVRYLNMIKACLDNGTPFGVVALTTGTEVRRPGVKETFVDAGTLAVPERIDDGSGPAGLIQVRCTGTQRFRINSVEQGLAGLWVADVTVCPPEPDTPVPVDLKDCADALSDVIAQLQRENVPAQAMPIHAPWRLDNCAWVANRWAELLPLPPTHKAVLLKTDDPVERLDMLREVLIVKGALP